MKKCLSVGVIFALILILVGCGGDSSSSETGSTNTSAGSSDSIPELRVGISPVRRIDYITSRDGNTFMVVAQVAPGLVTIDKAGKVVPLLAKSFEQPDAKTYEYTLDPKATFSDGKPVTVEDVVWSLERNRAKDSQTAANWTNVTSIEAQGDDTVVIKLKEPDSGFVNMPALAPIMQEAAALQGGLDQLGTPSNLPIGAGPFKIVSFTPDVDIKMERSDHWLGARPAAERVTFKLIQDPAAMSLALRSGDVDVLPVLYSSRGMESEGVKLYRSPGAIQTALSMNTIVAPYDDVHVRKALAYAIDREGLLEVAAQGDGVVNETLTPAQSLYGNIAPIADVEASFATLPKYDYDVEAAKAELAESGYPDGFSTTLPIIAGEQTTAAQAIAADLAKIGVKVDIDEMSVNEWLEVLYGPREKLGLLISGNGSGIPDPNELLGAFLDPAAAVVNGTNSANYTNPEVGRLLAAQRRAPDGAERLTLITELFKIVKEEVPYAPLYAPNTFMALSDEYVISPYSTWSFVTPWTVDIRAAS